MRSKGADPDSRETTVGKDSSPKSSEQSDTSRDTGISAPSITLPKGGGAIKGIGEKFAANPVTGTGSMSVPIATSPGRGGFGPQLSLSYDSGGSLHIRRTSGTLNDYN